MDFNVKDKVEYIIIFVQEFARRHSLTMRQAYNYLRRFRGIDFIDRHYFFGTESAIKQLKRI